MGTARSATGIETGRFSEKKKGVNFLSNSGRVPLSPARTQRDDQLLAGARWTYLHVTVGEQDDGNTAATLRGRSDRPTIMVKIVEGGGENALFAGCDHRRTRASDARRSWHRGFAIQAANPNRSDHVVACEGSEYRVEVCVDFPFSTFGEKKKKNENCHVLISNKNIYHNAVLGPAQRYNTYHRTRGTTIDFIENKKIKKNKKKLTPKYAPFFWTG